MQVDVSKVLLHPREAFALSLSVPLEDQSFGGETVRFQTPARLEGTMHYTGKVLLLSAKLTCQAILPCARCLEPVSVPLEAEVEEEFARQEDPAHPDRYLLDGFTLDVTEMVVQNLLMQLPIAVLCRDDCKGLCPICGENLNVNRCSCPQEGDATEHPFSALKQWKPQDEEV
ncbi:MAG: YceD family protein [Christensenellales bacterium]|jgi:uncharacterized protein